MKWINVKDALPTMFDKWGNSIPVIVHEKYNTIPFIGYYNNVRKDWSADTSNYDTNGDAIVIERIESSLVDFWMELPKEPEEEVK